MLLHIPTNQTLTGRSSCPGSYGVVQSVHSRVPYTLPETTINTKPVMLLCRPYKLCSEVGLSCHMAFPGKSSYIGTCLGQPPLYYGHYAGPSCTPKGPVCSDQRILVPWMTTIDGSTVYQLCSYFCS